MGDHATTNDPSNATFEEKGKGKDVQDQIAEDSSDEESDQEPEMVDEEEDDNNLEPISQDNIISGGRRTRGKIIDYAAEAEKNKDEMEDSEDDEDYQGANDDEDDQMRD
ncbi:uncharacterized protein N7469_009793 [Penicillium citrinum]|uniref:Histone chaperone domain-containing protein n=2 Tax=Penicillium TaxID=5073 RepID=A0A9W9NJ24_PENCI|nr:uncharacterized protein N7469_009793 [Penicillium citrinum]KAJ5220906.1 hypothetical protein N7469_009793 [Penicillium citrinum]KAJ5595872.1 hypothetical protein N7450_002330 [Penicillium hetheringtonii]